MKRIANLGELSAQQLQELDAELVTMFNTAREQELTVERVVELSEITASIDEVRAETGRRAELAAQARQEAAAKVEALAARVAAGAPAAVEAPAPAAETATETFDAVGVGAGDREDSGGAGKEEEEVSGAKEQMEDLATKPEAVAAAAVKLSPAAVSGAEAPVAPVPGAGPVWQGTPTIVASADVPGFTTGSSLPSMLDVANALFNRRQGIDGTSAAGNGEKIKVASIKGAFPTERMLSATDVISNMAKIEAVNSPQAIVAAGGVCAPAEPYYGLLNISSVDRPVKAALPTFMADRGSIRFMPPPTISQLSGAISITTAQQDASGYPPTPTKNVLHVTCAAEQQVFVTAISRILEFGNFGARTFPEQVEIWTNLSIAQAARQAEQYLLDQISAHSTAITATRTFGASRELLSQVDRAAAAMRSRHRTDPNLVLRALFPVWVKNLIRADLANTLFQTPDALFQVSDAQIDAWFAIRNIAPTFYLDGATNSGQVFGAQGAATLLTFPSTVVWYLFAEGSFLHLDAGVLDLGLVRDSTLNSTNDYEIFAEMFENVAFVGVESYAVTSTVCADGSYPAGAAALSCPQ